MTTENTGAQASTDSAQQTGMQQQTGGGTGGTGTGQTQTSGTQGTGGQQQQQQHTGTAGTQTGGSQTGTDGAAAQQPKAPEKYELKTPEGNRIKATHLKQIETMARANQWSNDDAQAAVNELDTQLRAQTEAWLAETKADRDYGGDKLAETQQLAKRVIDRIRPEGHARRESFLAFVNDSGYGNHIEVVSFLADLGKKMGEDTSTGQGRTSGAEETTADKMYTHPDSKKLAGRT